MVGKSVALHIRSVCGAEGEEAGRGNSDTDPSRLWGPSAAALMPRRSIKTPPPPRAPPPRN